MKKILLFSVLFLLLFSFSKNAYAYTPPSPTCYTTFDHVNVNGTYNKLYFVDGSASAYVNLSINAMDSWVNSVARTGVNTRIYYNRTAVKADSLMDIYYNLNTPPVNGVYEIAHTEFFVSSTLVYPWNQNWNWNRIILNTNSVAFSALSDYDKQGTLAHEMGHAFGLGHLTSAQLALGKQVVMLQMLQGRTVNQPVADDLNGINYMY